MESGECSDECGGLACCTVIKKIPVSSLCDPGRNKVVESDVAACKFWLSDQHSKPKHSKRQCTGRKKCSTRGSLDHCALFVFAMGNSGCIAASEQHSAVRDIDEDRNFFGLKQNFPFFILAQCGGHPC